MMKMRFRGVRCFPKGHTASKKMVGLNPDTHIWPIGSYFLIEEDSSYSLKQY